MNRTIKLLIISDTFLMTGFGLIAPILSIFINSNLIGGTIFMAGLASTIFLITKSVVQLPFSRYVDSHDDKIKWLIIGTFLITTVPFIYIFAKHVYVIYIAEVIYGVGCAFSYPVWLGLFSVNLDKKHEGFEWSVYQTFAGIGTAIAGAVGAAIAQLFSFQLTFLIVGIMSLIGCFILFGLEHENNKKYGKIPHHYHKMKHPHRNYR